MNWGSSSFARSRATARTRHGASAVANFEFSLAMRTRSSNGPSSRIRLIFKATPKWVKVRAVFLAPQPKYSGSTVSHQLGGTVAAETHAFQFG